MQQRGFVGSVLAFSFNGKLHQFKSARYWGWSTLGLAILAVNLGFPYMTQLVRLFSTDYNLYNWIYTISNNLSNFIVTALPIFLFALANDRAEYFGVNRNQVNLRPYWEILLLLVPIIAVASFETSFRNYYPTYKPNTVAVTLGWPDFLPPLVYEVAYGLDFFNVEYMFRGFFVIGMSKLLGKEAILPMVCTYCFLHFGKPPGECVSSIFGGYVLGVVAFYTRNIWGGVIVHIGLAWLMELAAFLQKAFNNA